MIRVISIRKAVLAGVAGAAAWELFLRALALLGLPLFDIVRLLGWLIVPAGPVWAWWAAGFLMHGVVGGLWAVFYAYFFWSLFDWRPTAQGVVFSLLPAILALFVMYPQLQIMHAPSDIVTVDPIGFLRGLGWREPAGLLIGHLVFGGVLGTLYRRPTGYATERPPRLPRAPIPPATPKKERVDESGFIFATGVECSYPTLDGGRWRFDQMEATGHYKNWRTDLELVREIGVTHLRYGPPLHLIYQGSDHYDWDFTDAVMAAIHDLDITPIVDLCHFGLPTWLENFQNRAVPEALRAYAEVFSHRYPWVRFYTPVNEMYVCARQSALDGVWNEQLKDERTFVTAVHHLAKANALMTQAILNERADAIFVNSESSEFNQPCCPDPEIVHVADFENERRFLPLDLIYGRPVGEPMRRHLHDHGLPDEAYEWFMRQTVPRRTILGIDYYDWNEKLIDREGRPKALGELFGWFVIARQYFDRYRWPMMHTETNHLDAREGPRWLWRQWHNVQLIRKSGVPIVGFTWYSLTDQVDWDIALAHPRGNVNPVGLFDLNRDPRPVGLAYKHLIEVHADEPTLKGLNVSNLLDERERR